MSLSSVDDINGSCATVWRTDERGAPAQSRATAHHAAHRATSARCATSTSKCVGHCLIAGVAGVQEQSGSQIVRPPPIGVRSGAEPVRYGVTESHDRLNDLRLGQREPLKPVPTLNRCPKRGTGPSVVWSPGINTYEVCVARFVAGDGYPLRPRM